MINESISSSNRYAQQIHPRSILPIALSNSIYNFIPITEKESLSKEFTVFDEIITLSFIKKNLTSITVKARLLEACGIENEDFINCKHQWNLIFDQFFSKQIGSNPLLTRSNLDELKIQIEEDKNLCDHIFNAYEEQLENGSYKAMFDTMLEAALNNEHEECFQAQTLLKKYKPDADITNYFPAIVKSFLTQKDRSAPFHLGFDALMGYAKLLNSYSKERFYKECIKQLVELKRPQRALEVQKIFDKFASVMTNNTMITLPSQSVYSNDVYNPHFTNQDIWNHGSIIEQGDQEEAALNLFQSDNFELLPDDFFIQKELNQEETEFAIAALHAAVIYTVQLEQALKENRILDAFELAKTIKIFGDLFNAIKLISAKILLSNQLTFIPYVVDLIHQLDPQTTEEKERKNSLLTKIQETYDSYLKQATPVPVPVPTPTLAPNLTSLPTPEIQLQASSAKQKAQVTSEYQDEIDITINTIQNYLNKEVKNKKVEDKKAFQMFLNVQNCPGKTMKNLLDHSYSPIRRIEVTIPFETQFVKQDSTEIDNCIKSLKDILDNVERLTFDNKNTKISLKRKLDNSSESESPSKRIKHSIEETNDRIALKRKFEGMKEDSLNKEDLIEQPKKKPKTPPFNDSEV